MIITTAVSPQTAEQRYYNNTIHVPKDLPAVVQESVRDMAYWLQKSTGSQFAIQTENTGQKQGIQLVWIDDAGLSRTVSGQIKSDGQSFHLLVNGVTGARIAGSGKESFVNGIYTFLQELGFRWYMPGDVWTIVPAVLKKNLNIDRTYKPDFQDRVYAGTGGINAIAGTDPANTFKQDYTIWNRRNRFGSVHAIKGHSGHLFYNANKKVLDANPSWFCNGKVNKLGRVDISHPEVVRLFTEWALGQVKPGENFPTIGIDPSDGSGGKDDCLPGNIKGVTTWSDKYFWLANQVADRLDKNDSRTQVQLYAYASHAAPPGFELRRNVYPIIVPYAFQPVNPKEFIQDWSRKLGGRPMGMYDYWNITQWSHGLPQFNIYSIPQKLRLWKEYNVSSINLESTNGKGAMGHAFWLASQMMWNTQLSFDSLYQDFLSSCFGPAANDIKRMYDRWSLNYQGEMEVNLSLHDLAAASAKTKDPAILARLNELKAYIHYLKLYYDYQANRNSLKAFEDLTNYIHAVHDMRLVQSSALLMTYIKAPKNPNTVSARPAKKEKLKISKTSVEEQFQRDIREHAATYSISAFNFDIRNAKPVKGEKPANPQYLNGRNEYSFFLATGADFEIEAGTAKETKLIIRDASKKWLEKVIPGSKEGYTKIKIKLPAGSYVLSFGDFARFSRLIFPADRVFVSSGVPYYDNVGFPLHYYYIPKDAKEIIYEDKFGPGVNKRGYWTDPDGNKLVSQKIKNTIYRVPVPPQYRGKVWTLSMGHRSFQVLNIPNYYSIRKFTYKED